MSCKTTKNTKQQERQSRKLKILQNQQFCACGFYYKTLCEGPCRESHTDENGQVKCFELYIVDPKDFKKPKKEKIKIAKREKVRRKHEEDGIK